MWLGTDLVFEAFQFFIKRTRGASCRSTATRTRDGVTFIVEMHEDVWRAAGFDAPGPPRASPTSGHRRIAELFADELGGHRCWPTTPSG
jgi:anthraniloyl-CoA monooxygenase